MSYPLQVTSYKFQWLKGNKIKRLNLFTFLPFCLFTLILISQFSIYNCFAQVESLPLPRSMQKELLQQAKKQRPTFTAGGGFGLQFGTFNAIDVAPFVGVYATPWLVVLANGQYSYMWNKMFFDSHVWGVGAALEPIIIKKIVIHAGYEFSQIKFRWLDGSSTQIENFHYFVVGAGYKSYMTNHVYFQALILFNIPLISPSIQNYYSNYYPFFRIVVGIDI